MVLRNLGIKILPMARGTKRRSLSGVEAPVISTTLDVRFNRPQMLLKGNAS